MQIIQNMQIGYCSQRLVCKLNLFIRNFHICTKILQGSALFSGKNYSDGKFFYITAGCDGRDKFQVWRQSFAIFLWPICQSDFQCPGLLEEACHFYLIHLHCVVHHVLITNKRGSWTSRWYLYWSCNGHHQLEKIEILLSNMPPTRQQTELIFKIIPYLLTIKYSMLNSVCDISYF